MANKWNTLPVPAGPGALMPHMSARMRTEMVDALFVGVGGYERARAWIEASDENYGEFFKMWSKGQARSTNVELSASEGVEALLERLEAEDRAKTIESVAYEVIDVEAA